MLEYLLGDNNVELIVKHTGADDVLVVVDDNNLKVKHAERVASWIEQRQNLAPALIPPELFSFKRAAAIQSKYQGEAILGLIAPGRWR